MNPYSTGWWEARPSCGRNLSGYLSCPSCANVALRVIPYHAGALPAGNNKFIILSFAEPNVSDVVFIEGLTGDLYLDEARDVEVYNTTFRTLAQLAADPDATRHIITSMIPTYHAQPG